MVHMGLVMVKKSDGPTKSIAWMSLSHSGNAVLKATIRAE